MISNNKSEEEKVKALHKLNGLAHNWKNAKGVGSIMRKYFNGNIRRIVVFCTNVKMAAEARNILGPWLATAGFRRMHFYNIDYKEKNVKKEMEDFQMDNFDGIKVAISVNMLNEGVHVDGVDAVVMMRSTVSPNIILQQIGRCLTAKKTEHKPVILDLVNNMNTLGDMRLWKFIGAKKTMGETSVEDSKEKGFPFRIIDECQTFSTLLEEIQNEFDVVTDYYPLFWKFIEENGRLPKFSMKEEINLYSWCGRVWRNKYGLADRFPEVYAKLKEMRWGEGSDVQTEMRVEEFFEFVNTNGRLPKYSIQEEMPLYLWCRGVWGNQNGLADRFPEVLAKLKEMRWGEGKDIRTEKTVRKFFEFVNTHGRLPKRSVKEENSLWTWCGGVWRNKYGLADRFPEVLAKLKEMRWGEGKDIRTEKTVRKFFEFVNTHGRLPKLSVKEEKRLYFWCRNVWTNKNGVADRYPEVLAKINELKGQK